MQLFRVLISVEDESMDAVQKKLTAYLAQYVGLHIEEIEEWY